MRPVSGVGLLVVLALTAAACSSGSSTPTPAEPNAAASDDAAGDMVRIENEGGSFEGHTPRGFAGMGTGLFAGDNLNPDFPDGDGVQLFLTFELPDDQTAPRSAVLRSDALHVEGFPFGDLGDLRAEPVSYDEFGPHLFDLTATGDPVVCARVDDRSLRCDVTGAVAMAVADGGELVQFRLRFDEAGDRDGSQDLALFFLTDSNTNEPGIFVLEPSR